MSRITKQKVGFIHTIPDTIGVVEKYMKQYLPETEFLHIYDSNIKIDNFNSPIGVTPRKNLFKYVNFAHQLEQKGCGVIVSCCSLMPRVVAYANETISVPIIQLDAVILDKAVELYNRIGVINTTEYMIPYVEEELKTRAVHFDKEIEIPQKNENERNNIQFNF